MTLDNMKRILIDLIFPNRCPLCGNVIHWSIDYCDKCYSDLPETGDEFCHRCGNDTCICRDKDFSFLICYSAYYYHGTARSAVIYLKNTRNYIFPRMAAEKIVSDMKSDTYYFEVDCIVPVPMTASKQRRRGYNQAEVIAEALSELLNVPIVNNVIIKKHSFKEQHKLTSVSRNRNADKIYIKTDSTAVKDKTVLLCDDVMTTGSTLNKCAEILIEMGAQAVIVAAATTTIK